MWPSCPQACITPGRAARLLDGERVDIPAYAEDGLAPILFAPDACHKAGLRWPGNRNARHDGKELRQVGGRFELFKGKLRVAVQMLLPCAELGNDAGYTRVKRHMDSPSHPGWATVISVAAFCRNRWAEAICLRFPGSGQGCLQGRTFPPAARRSRPLWPPRPAAHPWIRRPDVP